MVPGDVVFAVRHLWFPDGPDCRHSFGQLPGLDYNTLVKVDVPGLTHRLSTAGSGQDRRHL